MRMFRARNIGGLCPRRAERAAPREYLGREETPRLSDMVLRGRATCIRLGRR